MWFISRSASRPIAGQQCADRLKPPPSTINYENKKIKLISSVQSPQRNASNAGTIEKQRSPVTSQSGSVLGKRSLVTSTSTSPTKIKLSKDCGTSFSEILVANSEAIESAADANAVELLAVSGNVNEAKKFKPATISWP